MRKCQFCAEEIQDAAIVCKHCGRDHTGLAAAPAAAAKAPRWGRILIIVGVVLASPIVMMYCGEDHQRFLKFAEQRDAWHRKCDAYRQTPLTNPAAAACNQELAELTAYAKQQGW